MSLLSRLETVLDHCPQPAGYWVAFSGGCDSRVLLDLMAQLCRRQGIRLGAVHVDHGIQAHSAAWAQQCRRMVEGMGLEFVALTADGNPARGESPEAAARLARYGAFESWLPEDETIVSAHHRDDQAETLLLQLFRGSGPSGLAAMPERVSLGQGHLLRPLLDVSQRELRAWADRAGLRWIEDPSNRDNAFDRNFLRNQVIPLLRQRWPALEVTLARSARHAAEAASLTGDLAELDRKRCGGGWPGTLSLGGLRALSPIRATNLLRRWIAVAGLPVPSAAQMTEIRTQLLGAKLDRAPVVRWPGAEVRRYQDDVYALEPLGVGPEDSLAWDGASTRLSEAQGDLQVRHAQGRGIRLPRKDEALEIRFRHGGERLRPVSRRHHHDLKKLFQQCAVPPWERARIPLIYLGDRLAAVAGLWVDEDCRARHRQPGLMLRWSRWPAHPR